MHGKMVHEILDTSMSKSGMRDPIKEGFWPFADQPQCEPPLCSGQLWPSRLLTFWDRLGGRVPFHLLAPRASAWHPRHLRRHVLLRPTSGWKWQSRAAPCLAGLLLGVVHVCRCGKVYLALPLHLVVQECHKLQHRLQLLKGFSPGSAMVVAARRWNLPEIKQVDDMLPEPFSLDCHQVRNPEFVAECVMPDSPSFWSIPTIMPGI